LPNVPSRAARKQIIVDTDPGTDAMARMLAPNSPELDVRAVTAVPGNVVVSDNYVDQLAATHGPINDFTHGVTKYLLDLSAKFGSDGTPIYHPPAVSVAIDSALVKAPAMHSDVETRGEFTRGEAVANRHGYVERNVLDRDHFVIEGMDQVSPNAKVRVGVDAPRFLRLLVSRIQGR
jgi:inosine-uridine nucleoside N-ribohydrolase